MPDTRTIGTMIHFKMKFVIFFLYACIDATALKVFATPDNTQIAVWANEAIVATYTYNFQNFVARQKEIAKYFTADGWIKYTKALDDAKLAGAVKQNSYFVTAVATMPPTLKLLNKHTWQAFMPLLVVYKNPQYQQKQTLDVTLTFRDSEPGLGIRGFVITNIKAVVASPPCRCESTEPRAAIV